MGDMDLSKNTVFITGGASGIGLAIAKELLSLQNTVIVCGRNPEKLESVKKQYPNLHAIRCDVSNINDVRQVLEKINSEYGGLNILVNNAGIQYRYDFRDEKNASAKIDEEIDINFRAIVHLTKLFLPALMKAPEAAILNVSSFLGIVPKKSAPVYCATKAALHTFSKSLRYQLEKTTVKVFEIVTPLVDTDMTKGREDDMSKMSPEVLAKKVLVNVGKDNYEIRPGKSKIVLLFNRFFPSIAENIAKKR
jgi:short-subunit dehydrogenase involved in D-alanine esterification of teichoic acids